MKDTDFSRGARGKWDRKDAVVHWSEAVADLKREARANGLTDAEVDAELEAWRKETKP
jgi:hypothetical protein